MTDPKKGRDGKQIFQNIEMADKALQKIKKLLTEINVNNDIWDKVIDMKENMKEIGEIVVDLLVKRKENSEVFSKDDKRNDQIDRSQEISSNITKKTNYYSINPIFLGTL